MDRQLDQDGDPLAITTADAVEASGVPPWNWRDAPGNGRHLKFLLEVHFYYMPLISWKVQLLSIVIFSNKVFVGEKHFDRTSSCNSACSFLHCVYILKLVLRHNHLRGFVDIIWLIINLWCGL